MRLRIFRSARVSTADESAILPDTVISEGSRFDVALPVAAHDIAPRSQIRVTGRSGEAIKNTKEHSFVGYSQVDHDEPVSLNDSQTAFGYGAESGIPIIPTLRDNDNTPATRLNSQDHNVSKTRSRSASTHTPDAVDNSHYVMDAGFTEVSARPAIPSVAFLSSTVPAFVVNEAHHNTKQLTDALRTRVLEAEASGTTIEVTYAQSELNRRLSRQSASMALASPRQFVELLQEKFGASARWIAANMLITKFPEFSSHDRSYVWVAVMLMVAIALGIFTLFAPQPYAAMTWIVSLIHVTRAGAMLRLAIMSRHYQTNMSAPADNHCSDSSNDYPTYAVFVPLYREANMISQCVSVMSGLQYPKGKCEVFLILEHDDNETIASVRAIKLPENFRIIIVPPGGEKSKPHAMNYALKFTDAELVAVFDAEDIPDTDQLLKASRLMRVDPDIAVAQGILRVNRNAVCEDNRKIGRLTRLFNRWLSEMFFVDYAVQFRVAMPGFIRSGWSIPLCGTSNHFRRAMLQAAGGWDGCNVTEDADLGFRMAQMEMKTVLLDSCTWETPPHDPGSWLRQRTRWLKGWLQTYVVHLGPLNGFLLFLPIRQWFVDFSRKGRSNACKSSSFRPPLHLMCSAMPFALLVPITIYVTCRTFVSAFDPSTDTSIWELAAAFSVVGVIAVNVGIMLLGVRREGGRVPLWIVLSVPVYWVFLAIAFLRATHQLLYNPSMWEKTTHYPIVDKANGAPVDNYSEKSQHHI